MSTNHYIATCALVLALLCCPPSLHAGGLSAQDQATAASVAQTHPWQNADSARNQTRRRADQQTPVQHPLGLQTLSVENYNGKQHRGSAVARVYQYHHSMRRARRLEIDLATGAVLGDLDVPSVHLPLSDAEKQFALNLLAASNLIHQMQSEQQSRGQIPFTTLAELDVKAIIFEPMDSQHPCFSHRCALLSLFDSTRTVFSTEPLVHFANQQVTELRQH